MPQGRGGTRARKPAPRFRSTAARADSTPAARTARRGERPPEFDGATELEVDGRTYRRMVTPTSLWVHWNAPDRSYVLVGDLPPDHLLEVLERLPAPGERGLLVRLWRRLFG